MLALYIGGMGAKEMNFHFDVFVRMGFEAEAHKIQELYLDGHKDDAAAAVPTAMVEKIALIGPRAKIRRRPRRLAGVDRHHPARGGQSRHAPHDGGAPALTSSPKRKRVILGTVVVGHVVGTIVARRRGYSGLGGNTVVRCRQGHLFTTIWVPGDVGEGDSPRLVETAALPGGWTLEPRRLPSR